MDRKILIFVFAVFIFIFSSNVSAYQEKIVMKECVFSYDDDTFGNWNDAEQKGVFLRINNLNRNFGALENPNYSYTAYQPVRKYFNNFEYSNDNSYVPMLQVREGRQNMMYVNCTYKVGNYRIFLAGCGLTGPGIWLTHDFNLTTGIIRRDTSSYIYHYYNNIEYAPYNGVSSRMSSGQWIGWWQGSDIYYVDNGMSSSHSHSILYSEGLFPNTDITILYYGNLYGSFSGVTAFLTSMQENGYQQLMTPAWWSRIYINSSMHTREDIIGRLGPRLREANVKNENTGKVYNWSQERNSELGAFLVKPGDNLKAIFTLKNDYGFPTTASGYSYLLIGLHWTGGMGSPGTDISPGGTFQGQGNTSPLGPGEEKNISYNVTIPSGEAMPFVEIVSYSFYFHIGSDNVSYLGFGRLDPRITSSSRYGAVFDIGMELTATRNYAYTSEIKPNEYALLVELYKGSILPENKIENFTVALDNAEFAKMIPNTGRISGGSSSVYHLIIPIKDEYKQELDKYYVRVYSVKLTEPFRNKKIAATVTQPYFEPGNLLIPGSGGTTFYFHSDSKKDSKRVVVFNPGFERHNITLTVQNLPSNFQIDYPTGKIELGALSSTNVIISVNATHSPWPTAPQPLQRFTLTATSDQSGSNPTSIIYYLNVSPRSFNWINLMPVSLNLPSQITSMMQKARINATWLLEGSNLGFALNKGKNYTVNISVVKENLGTPELVYSFGREFNATSNFKREELVVDSDIAGSGTYKATLSLDTTNKFNEQQSGGGDGESDNVLMVYFDVRGCNTPSGEIDIGGCYYNSSDTVWYICNSSLNLEKSGGCTCGCPPCKENETLCADGYCRTSCVNYPNCNNNDICESGEGCSCEDCWGQQGNCTNNLVCNFNKKLCSKKGCGDGIVQKESGEECDGSDTVTGSCMDYGFFRGDLFCNSNCKIDSSKCNNNRLAAYWKLDEASGKTAVDSSGNGKNGTIYGRVKFVPGKKGGAYRFEGINSYVKTPALKDIVNFSKEFTILAWLNISQHQGTSEGISSVFSTHTWNPSSASLGFASQKIGLAKIGCCDLVQVTPDYYEWNHIAISYNKISPSISEARVYKNGILGEARNATWSRVGEQTATDSLIGSENGDSRFFNGTIDELIIFSAVLSDKEIKQIYDEGAQYTPPECIGRDNCKNEEKCSDGIALKYSWDCIGFKCVISQNVCPPLKCLINEDCKVLEICSDGITPKYNGSCKNNDCTYSAVTCPVKGCSKDSECIKNDTCSDGSPKYKGSCDNVTGECKFAVQPCAIMPNECNDLICNISFDCNKCGAGGFGDCNAENCSIPNIKNCTNDAQCPIDEYCPNSNKIRINNSCISGKCGFIESSCPFFPCTSDANCARPDKCSDNLANLYSWNCNSTNECNYTTNICPTKGNCSQGKMVCADGFCRESCTSTVCIRNGNCDSNEGCSCDDCTGIKGNCDNNLVCVLNGKCEDPDKNISACEAIKLGIQANCNESNEVGCWDELAPPNNKCCGDETENWVDSDKNYCCLGVFYLNTSNADENSCACNFLSGSLDITNINKCDIHKDKYCWDIKSGRCCGNQQDETWQYSSEKNVGEVLPLESCVNGSWFVRNASNATIYNIWVD